MDTAGKINCIGCIFICAILANAVLPCNSRHISLSRVDVTVKDAGDRYTARVAIDTTMDDWMVATAAWQLYHKSTDDGVLYQIPINDEINTKDKNVSAYVGDHEFGRPYPSLLQSQSVGRELSLSYMYTVADTTSRTGITLTEFIDTERTKAAGIPIERYSATELDIIKVYVDDDDVGRVFASQGDHVRLRCIFKTKYFFQRQWVWERTSTQQDALSPDVHPLENHVIARSKKDGSHVVEMPEYEVVTRDMQVEDGYLFSSELVIEDFDEFRHSGIYHCMVNDWSMAKKQPWLLTVDKFIELTPPGDQSVVEPSVLFSEENVFVSIETCSKKAPDENGTVFLSPNDPDCVVCLALSHTLPTLLKNGVEVHDASVWHLTVRNPHLHMVYRVFDRPSDKDIGTYTCIGSMFQHTTHKETSIKINKR